MARATGVSESTVGRIWRAQWLESSLGSGTHLQTFQRQTICREVGGCGRFVSSLRKTPLFWISAMRRARCEALDRTQPGLPLKKGRCGTLTHDYKRNGPTTMFPRSIRWTARLSGPVCRSIVIRNVSRFRQSDQTFRAERQQIQSVATTTPRTTIRKSSSWLKRNTRFHVHFTPTSASWHRTWSNRFFRDLSEQRFGTGFSIRFLS